MTTIQRMNFIKLATVSLFMLALITPSASQAATQTSAYQPQTQEEIRAYLYGRIAQLMQIKQLLDQGNTLQQAVDQVTVDYATISTYKATEIEATTAILRGEVNLSGKATASAWFEYGIDDDFLDQRTNKVSVRTAYERAVRVQVRNLKEDQRYYYRIVTQDNNKLVTYGQVYGFRTDESI